ncbi:hypothetical protein [Lysobacter fragariae]
MKTETATPVPHPQLAADRALLRLVDLLRSTRSVRDFTAKHLSDAMGVPFKTIGPGHWGFGEQLTPDWWYGMEMNETTSTGQPRFDFSFNSAPGTSPAMTSICDVDFAAFSSALQAAGFVSTPYHAEHGRLASHEFNRPGMRVEAYPEGEHTWSEEKGSGRSCVKMVLVW